VGKADTTSRVIKQGKNNWIRYLLIALTTEKIIQHILVTLAFYFDWAEIGSTVAIQPTVLMALGTIVAILFMIGLWGMITYKKWAPNLIIALAIFDIVGEFIAQGRIGIEVNVSILVATLLLFLALIYRKRTPGLA
jgi:hypothetical protein